MAIVYFIKPKPAIVYIVRVREREGELGGGERERMCTQRTVSDT